MQNFGLFRPIWAILSQKCAVFGVLFTGHNNADAHQKCQISGMLRDPRNHPSFFEKSFESLVGHIHLSISRKDIMTEISFTCFLKAIKTLFSIANYCRINWTCLTFLQCLGQKEFTSTLPTGFFLVMVVGKCQDGETCHWVEFSLPELARSRSWSPLHFYLNTHFNISHSMHRKNCECYPVSLGM